MGGCGIPVYSLELLEAKTPLKYGTSSNEFLMFFNHHMPQAMQQTERIPTQLWVIHQTLWRLSLDLLKMLGKSKQSSSKWWWKMVIYLCTKSPLNKSKQDAKQVFCFQTDMEFFIATFWDTKPKRNAVWWINGFSSSFCCLLAPERGENIHHSDILGASPTSSFSANNPTKQNHWTFRFISHDCILGEIDPNLTKPNEQKTQNQTVVIILSTQTMH